MLGKPSMLPKYPSGYFVFSHGTLIFSLKRLLLVKLHLVANTWLLVAYFQRLPTLYICIVMQLCGISLLFVVKKCLDSYIALCFLADSCGFIVNILTAFMVL